jgi:hypothetical protein
MAAWCGLSEENQSKIRISFFLRPVFRPQEACRCSYRKPNPSQHAEAANTFPIGQVSPLPIVLNLVFSFKERDHTNLPISASLPAWKHMESKLS